MSTPLSPLALIADPVALSAAKHKELQALCKGFDLSAAGKSTVLVQRLAEYSSSLQGAVDEAPHAQTPVEPEAVAEQEPKPVELAVEAVEEPQDEGDSLPTAMLELPPIAFGGCLPEYELAAEAELERRMLALAAQPGYVQPVSTLFQSLAGSLLSPNKSAAKPGRFDSEHERNFEKMDSIETHFTAKRSASCANLAGSLSRSASSRQLGHSSLPSSSSSRSLHQALLPTPTEDRPVKRLRKSPQKETVSTADAVPALPIVAAPILSTLFAIPIEQGAKADHVIVSPGKNRQHELAKARRQSKAKSLGKAKPMFAFGRKVETATAPAATFLKSAVSKAISSRPVASTSTAAPVARTAVASAPVKHTFGLSAPLKLPVPVAGPVVREKFDLKKSLARPTAYVPKTGSLAKAWEPTAGSNLGATSTPRKKPFSRKLSERVANPALLGAVKGPLKENKPITARAMTKPVTVARKLASTSSRSTRSSSASMANEVLVAAVARGAGKLAM